MLFQVPLIRLVIVSPTFQTLLQSNDDSLRFCDAMKV